ncbi:uncharacterized protein TNCT_29071 [Trichonephila clavata]|uniref:Uncharacterized protein n=1 Tax=Trichonephila clavata TaxID=2740835 RepID=A0A8X6FYI5_TRICU|nr:uncharacterized protein TNCT_29071 [Trichonephila clavata]
MRIKLMLNNELTFQRSPEAEQRWDWTFDRGCKFIPRTTSEHHEKCTQCGKVFPTSAKKLTHGYCQPCYQSSNGIALTKKYPSPSHDSERDETSSPNKESPPDHQTTIKRETTPTTELSGGGSPPPPPPMLLGMLDEVMLRYREAGGLLPPSLSALRFLEGSMPVLSQRN